MIEISGIPHEQNEDCINLAHQVCKLSAVGIKKKNIEIVHRIKNGDKIVQFTDRPKKHKYTSMNLYHLTLKNYFIKSGKNAGPLAIRKSLQIMELSKLR